MQGEGCIAAQVGNTYFRTCRGHLVGLTVKSTQTFVVTVVQEPLALHVGTFRFHSLYHDSTRAHGFTVIQRFIDAFDEYNTRGCEDNKAFIDVSVRFPPGPLSAERRKTLSEGSPAAAMAASFTSSSQELLNMARTSSLIMHEVSKIESMNRIATQRRRSSIAGVVNSTAPQAADADPATMDAAGIGLRETVYLTTEVVVDVKFTVFNTAHHVTLDLRPVPGSPAIVRELFVWNFLMEAFRANARLSQQARAIRLEHGVSDPYFNVPVEKTENSTPEPATVDDVKIRVPHEVHFENSWSAMTGGSDAQAAAGTPPSQSKRIPAAAPPPCTGLGPVPSAFDPKPQRRDPKHHPRPSPRPQTAQARCTLAVIAQPKRMTAVNQCTANSSPVPDASMSKRENPSLQCQSGTEHYPVPQQGSADVDGDDAAASCPAQQLVSPRPQPPSSNAKPSVMKMGRPASAGQQQNTRRPFSGDLRTKTAALENVLREHETRTGAKADGAGVIVAASVVQNPHEQGGTMVASSPRPSAGRSGALGRVVVVSLRGSTRHPPSGEENAVSPWPKGQ